MRNIDCITKQFVSSTKQEAAAATRFNELSQELNQAVGEFNLGEEEFATADLSSEG